MATLSVNGTRDRSPEPTVLGRALNDAVVVKHAARVHATRGGVEPLVLDNLEPDDVVEIELQDGLHVWTRVEDLPQDLRRQATRGHGDPGQIVLPSELTIGPASRASGGWAIKALKVIGLDIEEKIADFVADHVEGQLRPGPGLYRCSAADPAQLLNTGKIDGTGPVLLFLHGTASSAPGSFSGLWTGDIMKRLFEFYGGRVLAYQHRTLTESPIENALALTRELAAIIGTERELHIVSHSRGGLVGELLARGMRQGAAPFTPDDFALFDGDGRVRDRAALEQLSDALAQARLRVTRFVRVACPARGTTLADRRLDRYVSVLVNLASLIPALRANPVYDALTSLLAGVLKKRTDPEELPGIEAMMPTSPLVRMLNNPDVLTAADLHVLGGDLAGAGVFGRLKTLATDFYYRDDHDIVVNTPAMLGGTERTGPVRYWIDTGDQVTHFHYFARSDTARRLAAALTGTDTDFHDLTARPSAVTSADYRKRAMLSKPVVFVLPGIMGSELTLEGRAVWMNILELARGGLPLLGGGSAAKATGLLPDGYAALCDHLKLSHEVVPFPYDWRQPLAALADDLRTAIDAMLPLAESAKQPIRLLAHSMGGLVVRMLLTTKAGEDTWARMCEHPGARFIMLGTPNRGSFAIPAMLMGRDSLVKKLALVDLRSDHAALLQTIAAFEGVLHLLPHDSALDFFDRGVWERLLTLDAPEARGLFGSSVATAKSAGFRWALPNADALRRAKAAATAINASRLDARRVAYVAGTADQTACDVTIDEQAPAGRKVRVLASSRGDGRVLWDTGIPTGIRTYYMDTVHGDLASDHRHFTAVVELLETGLTSRLPTSPPLRRGGDEVVELRDPLPAMVPDEAELVAAALGGSRGKLSPASADEGTIALRVVHDNLTNARFPVLVSHYRHDVIVAAEAYLDERLDRRLSELLRMELYPGPINTGVVVLNDPPPGNLAIHPGAIVAGLGNVGELTPGTLTSTLAHALTLYGADCVGRARRRQQREGIVTGPVIPAPLTAILVGSGEGGLTLADSIRALLRAVVQANQRLRGGTDASSRTGEEHAIARIDQIEILELYEDRAIEALHVLGKLTTSAEFDSFVLHELLVDGDEGQRRVRFEQADGWWQRLRIMGDKDGLTFEALTQTARAPTRLRPTQRGLVDRFVQQAIETTTDAPRLGETLFELLVPNDFKIYAPERRKLALVLNPDSASIPWELMRDGYDRSPEPLAVSAAMIRQLRVENDTAQVLRAAAATALVIGNPHVSDPRFPPLTGASDEALSVATLLSDHAYDVRFLLEEAADPMSALTALHERPWRIMHLAAHGVFEFDAGDGRGLVSGLVLDDGVFLTASEATQLRHVPELVFINCCHLGQTRGDASPHVAFHRLAANLATEFIRIGARAVVAAGWAVDDAAAKTFATSFYRAMLRGQLYGDAVGQARSDTYRMHGESNTWGAYQCYGDPSFSLFVGEQTREQEKFVSPNELAIWLERQASIARREGLSQAALLTALTGREQNTPAEWWRSASVCALAGKAFAEIGQFEAAIDYYTRALGAQPASAPISTVEQLANCRVRLAGQLIGAPTPDLTRAAALLDDAERDLELLLKIGKTAERYSLLGGVHKRRAMMPGQTNEERKKALKDMSRAYKHAVTQVGVNGSGQTYPFANQLAAEVVLSWSKADRTGLSDSLATLEQLATADVGARTDTFSLSALADLKILTALADRDVDPASWSGVAECLAGVLSRGAGARVRESMRTQLRFFRVLAEAEFPETARQAVIARLEELEETMIPDNP